MNWTGLEARRGIGAVDTAFGRLPCLFFGQRQEGRLEIGDALIDRASHHIDQGQTHSPFPIDNQIFTGNRLHGRSP